VFIEDGGRETVSSPLTKVVPLSKKRPLFAVP